VTAPVEPPQLPADPAGDLTGRLEAPPSADDQRPSVLNQILNSSTLISVLAVVLALVIGGILIAAADPDVQETLGYFFARPGDFFSAVWTSVSNAYIALFQGAIYNTDADSVSGGLKSLTDTMTASVPLIFAGLGLGIGFRAGMFNIGAQGQIILGAIFAGYIGFAFQLPPVLHLILAVLGAVLGGAIWAGIAGALKARTGANEVIVTIMLNYIALYLLAYLLSTSAFLRPGSINPKSPAIESTAVYPKIFDLPGYRLHWGFILALVAAVGVWWLMERSTIGFGFRAVGANPDAARTAGISVRANYFWVMVTAGGLAGLAGSAQILGTVSDGLTVGVAASYGFDAITVALLGRSRPLGTVLAGLLFGALQAGGYTMQSRTGTPIDVVLVLQSLIVLLIAAPPLVRAVFFLPGRRRRPKKTPKVGKPVEVAA
jgi:general nucleoside transport system permease protein